MRYLLLSAVVLLPGCTPEPATEPKNAPSAAPAPRKARVKPGQVAVSKPDKSGLVTMLRPIVSQLHADDPFRVALHWAGEKEPLPAHKDNRPFARFATLRSMTFVLTSPGGTKHELKADAKPPQGQEDWNLGLYCAPTFLLTFTKEGLREDRYPQTGPNAPWIGKPKLDLNQAGVWKVRISGTITDGKAQGIAFEAGEIELELGADIRTQKEVQTIATEALEKKVGAKAGKNMPFLREDKDGNRVVVMRGSVDRKWSFMEYTVPVEPNGTVGKIAEREVSTCVARGTLIDTEAGRKPIELVRASERVWGWSFESQRRVLTTVRVVRQHEASQTLLFGDGLRVTPNHPVWVGSTWKPAAEVKADELLLDGEGRSIKAGSPRVLQERVAVFDLTVDEPHCYFAGGFLVHNKDRAYWPKLDDPWYSLWPE